MPYQDTDSNLDKLKEKKMLLLLLWLLLILLQRPLTQHTCSFFLFALLLHS